MASISALGTAPASLVNRTQNPLATVARMLDMSTAELKKQLGEGKSLNDVAQELGVTHDDLISTLKSTLPWPDAPASFSAGVDAVAEKMAGTVGVPVTPPPPPPPPADTNDRLKGENSGMQDPAKVQQLGRLLRMDSSSLTSTATSASGLVGLFRTRSVPLSKLKQVYASGDLIDVSV